MTEVSSEFPIFVRRKKKSANGPASPTLDSMVSDSGPIDDVLPPSTESNPEDSPILCTNSTSSDSSLATVQTSGRSSIGSPTQRISAPRSQFTPIAAQPAPPATHTRTSVPVATHTHPYCRTESPAQITASRSFPAYSRTLMHTHQFPDANTPRPSATTARGFDPRGAPCLSTPLPTAITCACPACAMSTQLPTGLCPTNNGWSDPHGRTARYIPSCNTEDSFAQRAYPPSRVLLQEPHFTQPTHDNPSISISDTQQCSFPPQSIPFPQTFHNPGTCFNPLPTSFIPPTSEPHTTPLPSHYHTQPPAVFPSMSPVPFNAHQKVPTTAFGNALTPSPSISSCSPPSPCSPPTPFSVPSSITPPFATPSPSPLATPTPSPSKSNKSQAAGGPGFSFTDFFLAYMSSCNASNPSNPKQHNTTNGTTNGTSNGTTKQTKPGSVAGSAPHKQDSSVTADEGSEHDGEKPEKAAVDPRKYKTRACRNWEQNGSCPYEHTCCFAHGEDELRDLTSNHKLLASIGYFSNVILLAMTNGQKPALPPHCLYQQPGMFPVPQSPEELASANERLPEGVSFPFQEPMAAALRGLKREQRQTQDEGARRRRRGRRGKGCFRGDKLDGESFPEEYQGA